MNTRNNGSQQNSHYQQQYRSQQQGNRFQSSLKDRLEEDLRRLERELVTLDIQIDALSEKGKALEAAKNQHMQSIPLAIAQVALSTLGVTFLPPVARTWHYKRQQYLRTEEQLRHSAIALHTRRNVLVAQMEQVEIQIDMLQFHP